MVADCAPRGGRRKRPPTTPPAKQTAPPAKQTAAPTTTAAATAVRARHIFLTGQPSVGKTTLLTSAAAALNAAGLRVSGFFTEERRGADGGRAGFDVVSLGGDRGCLATLGSTRPVVGKYSVDVAGFESVALDAMAPASVSQTDVVCVDEVGKMELFSEAFLPRVHALLVDSTGPAVFGTLPMPRYGHTIAPVEALRARADVAVVKLLKGTRDDARAAVLRVLMQRPLRGGAFDVAELVPFLQEGQLDKLRAAGAVEEGLAGGRAFGRGFEDAAAGGESGAAAAVVACGPLLPSAPMRVLLLGGTASAEPQGVDASPYEERSLWPVLGAALGLPADASFARRRDAAAAAGVAVWDVLRNVHGAPASEAEVASDVSGLARGHVALETLAFIGKGAHRTFLKHHRAAVDARGTRLTLDCGSGGQQVRHLRLVVLPSSSRAAAIPLEQKVAAWREALAADG